MTDIIYDGPRRPQATLVLAHGAGVGMDSLFMQYFAEQLAARKIRVGRFEFPYMVRTRAAGSRKPPDRPPVLMETWRDVLRQIKPQRLFIGGKSLGGRIASMIADETKVDGLVCLGYPFHPPGKPQSLRVEHLTHLKTPMLICQGERDAFGNKAEVADYRLSQSIQLHWLADGDHSFKPRKSSGLTERENWDSALGAISEFLK